MEKPLLPAPDKNGVCRPNVKTAMGMSKCLDGHLSTLLMRLIIASAVYKSPKDSGLLMLNPSEPTITV
jgi:hypothetical protein